MFIGRAYEWWVDHDIELRLGKIRIHFGLRPEISGSAVVHCTKIIITCFRYMQWASHYSWAPQACRPSLIPTTSLHPFSPKSLCRYRAPQFNYLWMVIVLSSFFSSRMSVWKSVYLYSFFYLWEWDIACVCGARGGTNKLYEFSTNYWSF